VEVIMRGTNLVQQPIHWPPTDFKSEPAPATAAMMGSP